MISYVTLYVIEVKEGRDWELTTDHGILEAIGGVHMSRFMEGGMWKPLATVG